MIMSGFQKNERLHIYFPLFYLSEIIEEKKKNKAPARKAVHVSYTCWLLRHMSLYGTEVKTNDSTSF
jgi:hypothetical protein